MISRKAIQAAPNSLDFDDDIESDKTRNADLEKVGGLPPFFLSDGHIDRRTPFWFDRLDYALQHYKRWG